MKEKIRANLKEASKYYDEEVFSPGGFENPEAFKKSVVNMILIRGFKGKKLLDVACGNGNFLSLAENYFESYGIDFSKTAVSLAKKRCPKCKIFVTPAEKLNFPSRSFDVITCLGSLEHFVDMGSALKEMKRVLRKNGIAIIHVPNSRYLVHKVLRVKEHGQINERMATESEWKEVLEKYFVVEKAHRYNTKPYLKWIPKRYCCHFTFICKNSGKIKISEDR